LAPESQPQAQSQPQPFDPCGSLPGPGVTVLEASAGTGKTFTIAALAARFVAQGVPIENILAVTFTRIATAELRDRVRARLVSAESSLGRYVDAGVPVPIDDRVVRLLADGTPPEVRDRRSRLKDALAIFDAATITTTHGFCHLVLAGLGVAGRVGVGATLIEDASDTVDEVVDDLFLRRVLGWGVPPFERRVAHEIARVAVANPVTPLEPDAGDSIPGRQRRLAESVRREVARRLHDRNLLTYDDLLTRLQDTLADPERGEAACRVLRERYQVVLVDEFQDTDPVQWEVVRRAFGGGQSILVLIGDPKQAIYAFRGADVYAYLDAARRAQHRFTLSENWRSDAGLLAAYDALLNPLHVGHPEIPYRPVAATASHQRPGLLGAPGSASLRFRVLYSGDGLVRRTARGAQKDSALEWVAGDLASDVLALLESPARIVEWRGAEEGASRRVSPGDVAVLVRTNRQAGLVQAALRAVSVPAVIGGTESVFGSPSAPHWLRLLEALEQPASRARAVAVALTPFIGMTADDVAGADEATWELLHARLHRWSEILRQRGVATVTRAIMATEGLPARILLGSSGERDLTDLGHIAELLHSEASAGQLGAPALRAWLARRIEESGAETADAEDRSRRLDSDADAVQVLTIHRAKGLEFPVVYCPYLWDSGPALRKGRPVVYHDPTADNRRTLDVGVTDPGASYLAHFSAAHDEQRGEDLRLLYVALTRARHRVVVWWVRAYESQHSPLGRLLMSRDGAGNVAPSATYSPNEAAVQARLRAVADRVPGQISVERCTAYPVARWEGAMPAPGELAVARFERSLDRAWRRTSYSGITAGDQSDTVGSEPELPGLTDEPDETGDDTGAPSASGSAAALRDPEMGDDEAALRAVPSPLAETPRGAEMGTFVHAVLERVDFDSADLTAAVNEAVLGEQSLRGTDIGSSEHLVVGLVAALSTPLGHLVDDRSLRSFGPADRLDELRFELPLAGGDRPSGRILTADIARLFATSVGPGTALDGYAARLASPALASHLRGYLTGSLDLVLRIRPGSGRARYLVVDYKTNWLAPGDEPLCAWHYRPDALAAEMQRDHYPLQALLYLVALHRYLRWRMPGYDPEANLAGILYLFLRGMSGPEAPLAGGLPCGVFSWPTPPALVVALSDLLDKGSAPA
jgi:exodeoxyribonuclease V beta subunit